MYFLRTCTLYFLNKCTAARIGKKLHTFLSNLSQQSAWLPAKFYSIYCLLSIVRLLTCLINWESELNFSLAFCIVTHPLAYACSFEPKLKLSRLGPRYTIGSVMTCSAYYISQYIQNLHLRNNQNGRDEWLPLGGSSGLRILWFLLSHQRESIFDLGYYNCTRLIISRQLASSLLSQALEFIWCFLVFFRECPIWYWIETKRCHIFKYENFF